MKFLKYTPTVLTLCLILGISIGSYLSLNTALLLFISLGLLLLLWFLFYFSKKHMANHYLFSIVAYILFVFIGMTTITMQRDTEKEAYYSHLQKIENSIYFKINKRLKPTKYHEKYEVAIININHKPSLGKVLVNIRRDSLVKRLEIGSIYYTKTQFKPISKPKNPYGFDYSKYLKNKQIENQIFISNATIFKIKDLPSFKRITTKIIYKINNNLIHKGFKKDELAIVNALLLGQRQDISKNLITAYQNAGAVHILAVSGLHIGIVFAILLFLFSPFKFWLSKNGKGKILQYGFAILFLWFYAFLAGMSASIVRSVTMFTALAIGILVNRKTSAINSLFLSAFILLLIHPLFLFDIGFQLSYLAVFSIVFWHPVFLKIWHPKNKIILFFWQIFTVSLSAQIGIIPISLYYFHQFPALFFVSGLLILPVLGILLGFGFLVITLAYFNMLPDIMAKMYLWCIHILNQLIIFIAKQETFLIKQIFFSVLLLIGSYILIIAIYRLINRYSYKKMVNLLLSILLFQGILMYHKYFRESEKSTIIFNDSKNTMIAVRNGNKADIYFSKDTVFKKNTLKNYQIGTGITAMNYHTLKQNYLNKILIIDSLGVYKIKNLQPEIVLLSNSPKINIERMIHYLKPKMVVADASNYYSYSNYYQQKCKKLKVPFYNTREKGALVLKR